MPLFDIRFTSADHPGKRFKERVEARNVAELRAMIEARRGFLFFHKEIVADAGAFRTKIPAGALLQLCNLIAMQLRGRVATATAIARLRDEFPNRAVRRILTGVHNDLTTSTAPLSGAMQKYPRAFPPGVIASIRIGEKGGRDGLALRFAELRDAIAFRIMLRKSTVKMLAYPAFVIVSALSIVSFILVKLIPLLRELLLTLNSALPPTTLALIAASDFTRAHWPALLGVLLLGIASYYMVRRNPSTAATLDRFILRVPYFGYIVQSLATAQVCKAYRALYVSGAKAGDSLSACADITDNLALKAALRRARVLLESGVLTEKKPKANAITEALRSTGYFPELALTIIDTAEPAGPEALAEALQNVAEHYAGQAKERIEIFFAVFEKLLFVAIAFFVGTVVLSVIHPIINATSNFH